MRAYLVDRELDTLKQEKQLRSETCRVSRVHSHQLEVGTKSGDRVSDSESESESEQDSDYFFV
jgi:hypothetical protein